MLNATAPSRFQHRRRCAGPARTGCGTGNATLLLNSEVPIAEVARRLGHSPDVLLSVYAGVTTSDRDTANALIDAALDTSP
jgi:trans-aconitate methyltransferase